MSKLTRESTVGDLYRTPVGEDVVNKLLLQLGVSRKWVTNPLVAHLKFSTILRLAKGKVDPEMIDAILHLAGSEDAGVNADAEQASRMLGAAEESAKEAGGVSGAAATSGGGIRHAWWKEAVFYQIYPRSFVDGNGDGIGDLPGIISKLDYLKELGIDAIWLSPIYDSPNDDNGYDIRDYHKIMQEFGTMDDFDRLLNEVHQRGMYLIMDLVVNHTSDEHAWFQKALADPEAPERDYYFFVPDAEGKEAPNNWVSFFSGGAWNYYPEAKAWALHLFSRKQMDLNWDNPAVRSSVIDMVNRWLDKGVDGFRMDVINYISKERSADGSLPQGNQSIGDMMTFTGIEHYYYGPHLHDYLRELQEKAFRPHGAFSVGETPGLGMRMAQLVTGEGRGELDMVFSFDQLESPGHVRFDDYQYDLNYYRDYITDWMLHYGDRCWMSLFYNNHDNPRMCSKVTTDPAAREAVQTLLAVMQFTLKGTPFIFQGDEMGLTNYAFTSMDEITDVESQNLYRELTGKGMSHEEAFATILAGTREHCRVLLPWNHGTRSATGQKPVPFDHLAQTQQSASGNQITQEHEAAAECGACESTYAKRPTFLPQEMHAEIFKLYRDLIALRKTHPTLIYGAFRVLKAGKDRFVYQRSDVNGRFVIECNLGAQERRAWFAGKGYALCMRTKKYADAPLKTLGAYEARIWQNVV